MATKASSNEAQDLRVPTCFHHFRPSADHVFFQNQDLLPHLLPPRHPNHSPRKSHRAPVSKIDLYLPKRTLLNEALLVPLSAKR